MSWRALAVTAALIATLHVALLVAPSTRGSAEPVRVIGGPLTLTIVGLAWLGSIVVSLTRSLSSRRITTALDAVSASIAGFLYLPWWAREVALPTPGGISPVEVMGGFFPFAGDPAVIGVLAVSLLSVAALALGGLLRRRTAGA